MSEINLSRDLRIEDTDFIDWVMGISLVRPFGIDQFSIIGEIRGQVLLLWLPLAAFSDF
jgi:hypothetical protein